MEDTKRNNFRETVTPYKLEIEPETRRKNVFRCPTVGSRSNTIGGVERPLGSLGVNVFKHHSCIGILVPVQTEYRIHRPTSSGSSVGTSNPIRIDETPLSIDFPSPPRFHAVTLYRSVVMRLETLFSGEEIFLHFDIAQRAA